MIFKRDLSTAAARAEQKAEQTPTVKRMENDRDRALQKVAREYNAKIGAYLEKSDREIEVGHQRATADVCALISAAVKELASFDGSTTAAAPITAGLVKAKAAAEIRCGAGICPRQLLAVGADAVVGPRAPAVITNSDGAPRGSALIGLAARVLRAVETGGFPAADAIRTFIGAIQEQASSAPSEATSVQERVFRAWATNVTPGDVERAGAAAIAASREAARVRAVEEAAKRPPLTNIRIIPGAIT
jgi:hypothetical protein